MSLHTATDRAQLYHSTPETQTDESYTHPEDLEHFRRKDRSGNSDGPCADKADHAHIEAEEEARERKFAGLDNDADLMQEHPAASDPLDTHAHAPGEGPDPSNLNPGEKAPSAPAGQGSTDEQDAQKPLQAGSKGSAHPQRADAKGAPSRMRTKGSMSREELEEMGRQTAQQGGSGSYHGHGRPRSPEERLKAPYSKPTLVDHGSTAAPCRIQVRRSEPLQLIGVNGNR